MNDNDKWSKIMMMKDVIDDDDDVDDDDDSIYLSSFCSMLVQ